MSKCVTFRNVIQLNVASIAEVTEYKDFIFYELFGAALASRAVRHIGV